MALIIDLDIDKCSACGACAVACMDQNDIDTQRCEAPFRVVFDLEQPDGRGHCKYTYMATACMHCAEAPCVTACPCGCLAKDPETGPVHRLPQLRHGLSLRRPLLRRGRQDAQV